MRVLVTGGAGFIGSHIADRLVDRGDEVVVLDDLSNGLRANVPDGATLVVGDVRDKADVGRAIAAFPGGRPADTICHLAGQASTFRSFDSPSWDMMVNGVGTAHLIEAGREVGVHTFVHASSMTAYGTPPSLPMREDMPCAPLSFYGATKWVSERAVIIAATEAPNPFRAVAFRMFNVYGPRQSLTNAYQGVMGIFLGRVLRNEPILLFGDGEQSRDFVYVGDVAEAWVLALDGAPVGGTVLNLGRGDSITMNALWSTIVARCGHDPARWPVEREGGRPGDQRHSRADISAAERVLGWVPKVDLDEGLRHTVAWAENEAHALIP